MTRVLEAWEAKHLGLWAPEEGKPIPTARTKEAWLRLRGEDELCPECGSNLTAKAGRAEYMKNYMRDWRKRNG